jgi:hypothetical protein
MLQHDDSQVKIFLSYASEQAEIAQSVDLALRGEGHSTFLDQATLAAGEQYNQKIRNGVRDCDLFIFLLSPESITHGRYSLTELTFAQEKWPSPAGHVLPVLVAQTEMSRVPPYLRAVSILEPSGDVAASVAAEVGRFARPWWHRRVRQWSGVILLTLLAGGIIGMWRVRHDTPQKLQRQELNHFIDAARLQEQAGNDASAWDLVTRAASLDPNASEVVDTQTRIAMQWLRRIRVVDGKETFTDVVNKVLPVLSLCAASAPSQHTADCVAHLGWADFLRSRDGVGGLDPAQYYQRSLKIDSSNVFAHAMLAHYLVTEHESAQSVRNHFALALASGREREFVRAYQFAAFLYYHDPRSEVEAIRVADDMQRTSEPLPPGPKDHQTRWRLWDVYYSRVFSGDEKAAFLSALPPDDHLATFRWLFPEDVVPEDKRNMYLFVLATLEEGNGQRAQALETYKKAKAALDREGARGTLLNLTAEAVKRLSR